MSRQERFKSGNNICLQSDKEHIDSMELESKLLDCSSKQPSQLRAPSTCSCQFNGLGGVSVTSDRPTNSNALGQSERPKLALNSTASATSMQSVIKMLGEYRWSR